MADINWKEKAKLYEMEVEAFSIFYEESLATQQVFMVFAGVITRMRSELLEYELKNGKAKTQAQNERIEELLAVYLKLSGLSEQNFRLRYQLSSNNLRMMELEAENCKMKVQIDGIEKAFNQD